MGSKDKIKILIIDNEHEIRQSFGKFLESHDYNVICAADSKKGLKTFKQEKIDLILVDLYILQKNDLEVLSWVSKNSPDLPVIAVSGTGVIADVVEVLHEGAWDYLLKPVEDLSILLHVVSNALGKANLKIENSKYQEHLEKIVSQKTNELQLKAEGLEKELHLCRKAEQKLKNSLDEKNFLLKEIHHRVKNNLAIISSFLSLKEQSVSEAVVKQTFKDCRQRIQVMAHVHNKLYGNDKIETINIKEYFYDIFNDLIGNYHIGPISIAQQFDIDELFFSLDLLIPIGLVINEALTNSFKYAFNGIDKPLIIIELKKRNEKNIILRIADNGNGFKIEDVNDKHDSIGIDIIKALVNQIGGSIVINSEKGKGVEYLIDFSI